MSENLIEINDLDFEEVVLKSKIPVMVYFYSDDCNACKSFIKIFSKMPELAKEQIKFVKIRRNENTKIANKYSVKVSPTVVFFNNGTEVCTRLNGYIKHPELMEAMEKALDKKCEEKKRNIVRSDLIILGGGPSGLTSAIYAARSKVYTVVIDSSLAGGQAASTFQIENYPGTNGVIQGVYLMENMKNQAKEFDVQIQEMNIIKEVNIENKEKCIITDKGEYYGKAVIIATGAEPRKLPVDKEEFFRGRGVHYCATCDGAFYREAEIMVVGGGVSAIEEALFLTRFAKKVTLVYRGDKLKAPKASIEEICKHPQTSILLNSEIKKLHGESFLEKVTIENNKEKTSVDYKVEGVFVYIGMVPNTSNFSKELKLTTGGYIEVNSKMETNIKGVFAAGDVIDKEIRQISTAVGDGTIAGVMAEKYINRKFEPEGLE